MPTDYLRNDKPFIELLRMDYRIPFSPMLVKYTIVGVALAIGALLASELLFDFTATSKELLLPFFVVSLGLVALSRRGFDLENLGLVLLATMLIMNQVHFFANPKKFHILVYWGPILPMLALAIGGIKWSLIALLIKVIAIVGNAIYARVVIGETYTADAGYIPFLVGGLIFLVSVFSGFFLLYHLLGQAYHQMKLKNVEIERLNNELFEVNDTLESLVEERVKEINEQNVRLKKSAFMNSHMVRAALTKILGAAHVFEKDQSKRDQMLRIIVNSSQELDDSIKEIGKMLEYEEGKEAKPSQGGH